MFFILSKILSFLLTPIVWIVALLLFSWITKNEKRKKRSFMWGMILLLVFSNRFILDEAVRAWEIKAIPQGSLHSYDAAVVPGGLSSWDPTLQRIQFNRAGDRLFQAIELYKKGIVRKIVFTGGSGSLQHQQYKEGDYVQRYLRDIGLPDSAIVIERNSRNTYENAVMTKKLLDSLMPNGNYLLVTSGMHLRRAKACFDKAGLKTMAYSTDNYSGPRKFQLDHLLLPDAETLQNWNFLLHELSGYVVYKMKGYL